MLKRKSLFSLIPDPFCFYFEWFNTVQLNLPLLYKKNLFCAGDCAAVEIIVYTKE
jgi:hypothetical protein